MGSTAQTTAGRWLKGAGAFFVLPVAMFVPMAAGQAAGAQTATAPRAGVAAANAGSEPGVVLDRLVAVVNEDVILESDVDEERRVGGGQPERPGTTSPPGRILERVIDPGLILPQEAPAAPQNAS